MSALTESTFAWEPVTPRGVAAYARASFERLFVMQTIFALIAAIVVLWLFLNGFFPTIATAINQLPETGQISGGKLTVPDASPQLLADGHFLAFVIDGRHGGTVRSPAQFQCEFGDHSLLIYSIFGVGEVAYPPAQSFYFNRTDLQPMWGAWAPEILGLAALAVFFGLLLAWLLLATLYFFPVWLVSFFANRDLNFRESWRLAGAALMPGALLMSLSLWLYGLGVFDVIKLCFACGMHLLIGWIYLFISPLFLKRALPQSKSNPFTAAK